MQKSKVTSVRERKGLTQADLSRLLGIARATVSTAEKKGIRNVAAAKRYARALNCDPLEIIEL